MQFQLKVHKPGQGVALIESAAGSMDEAVRRASEDGWHILSVRKVAAPRLDQSASRGFHLVLFAEELLALLSAGLPLLECIEVLHEKAGTRQGRAVLDEVVQVLRSGRSLSQAMGMRPDVFPDMLRASIEASERTGAVTQALERYLDYAKRFKLLEDRLKGALIYPLLLGLLGFAVVVFMLLYVVPRFSVVFADRMDELPAMSAVVVRIGIWISGVSASQFAIVCVAIVGAVILAFRRGGWSTLGRAAEQLPWIRATMHSFRLSRMYRSLGMLTRGGIPVPTAMTLVGGHLGAAPEPMLAAIERVREGLPLSLALQQAGLSTNVTERLVSAGERSGRVSDMLEAAADFLDQELARRMEWAVRLAEPVLMAVIGLVVGGIVVLMYLPIFQLADSIQ